MEKEKGKYFKVDLKLNERSCINHYEKVVFTEIKDGFLIICREINSKHIRLEPISLSLIDYWDEKTPDKIIFEGEKDESE